MARCKECYHYSACYAMAKVNLDELGISDYDGNADGCKDFIPTADVVEVRHGRWIEGRCDGKRCIICSNCGSHIPTDTKIDFLNEEDNRFCYWCGAKMDGKE